MIQCWYNKRERKIPNTGKEIIMEKKLAKMPYAQAKVRLLNGFYHNELISYQTTVAAIRGGWLYIYGLYSATTRRHIDRKSTRLNSSHVRTSRMPSSA